MAATKCTNIEIQNPSYATLQVSKQEQSLYDSPQQQQHVYESTLDLYEKPTVPSLVPELESKEVVSSNIQHVTNSVGNYSIQKERVKWSILLMLLIALSVLNVIILITLFTTQVTCPQVGNTTEMVQSIVQEVLSLKSQEIQERPSNASEETLLQLINMSYDNVDLLKTHIELTQSSQQLLDVTNKNVTSSLQKLNNIINTQSIIEDISVENKGTINNILVKVDDVLETLNSSLVSSCQDIKNKQPNSPSGYYHINSQIVYCEMGELCSTEGGWTRLAYMDMTDSTVNCPTGFKLYESGSVRACGRSSDNAPGCQSIKFPSNGISYSEVCGRVVGYQYGSPDALGDTTNNIDTYYADGVSITQGYPRKHVWTLINGLLESIADYGNCPCNTPPGRVQPPSFVGNDYFCESGIPDSDWSPVLRRETVVQLLVSHGFIRHLTLQMNILR